MVSLRCKNLVIAKLEKLSIPFDNIELGYADLPNDIDNEKIAKLNSELKTEGLEILDNHNAIIIEKIKNIIIELVHYDESNPLVNLSDYIAEKLHLDYGYLTNLFTKVRGETIQQYYIHHKIEKAKELIFYDEKSLTEIADILHYSSIAHFSNQFKKVTGVAPSVFKKMKTERKTNIENL
jgi:YesN/AraC family two-component response regulator